ncbi:MAG TPA: RecT family recombinase, partial [Dissulfurispiraceae bacterium]|nr:RecT family recombinase [Dissulfurispiraceae bacterium]
MTEQNQARPAATPTSVATTSAPSTQELALMKKDVVDIVAAKINKLVTDGELHLPDDYSAENALKSAWLILQETTDKNKVLVLRSCTKDSIANALYGMIIQGLNPAKKQGYFIAYGNQLQFQRSYFGTAAVAKRTLNCFEPWSEVVYEKDDFEYEIKSNRKQITKHTQRLENIDQSKIKAVYCVIEFQDNRTTYTEIMTMEQIKESWKASKANPDAVDSIHRRFTDQMAKRTVINRACKLLINTTTDNDLLIEHFNRSDQQVAEYDLEVEAELLANRDPIDIIDDRDSFDDPTPGQPATAGQPALIAPLKTQKSGGQAAGNIGKE